MFNLPKSFFRSLLLALCTVATPALAATSIEFYNAGINHYFMTASTDEAASLDNKPSWGWARTGKTFDVSLTQASAPSNASPVCRFYGIFSNGTVGSHFYTVDQDECAYVKSRLDWGWGYEGDAFYAVKPTGGACPTGTSPVYRAYNNGMGGAPNHRYMTSQAEVDAMVLQGWVSESVVVCAPDSSTSIQIQQPGVVTLTSSQAEQLIEVDTDIFTAPQSMGLQVGSIFIFDSIAYKVSLVAPSEDGQDRVKLYTVPPLPTEVFSSLVIKGRIPLVINASSSPDVAVRQAQTLDVKRIASGVARESSLAKTMRRLQVDSAKLASDPPCQVSAVPSQNEFAPGEIAHGFITTLSCTDEPLSVTGTLELLGYLDIDYDLSRNDQTLKTHFEVNPSLNIKGAIKKDFRKNIGTLVFPVGGPIGQIIVPINLIAKVKAGGGGSASVGLNTYVDANLTYLVADPWNSSYTFTGGLRAHKAASANLDISAAVGVGADIGIAAFGLPLVKTKLEGTVIAEAIGTSTRTDGCIDFSIKLGLDAKLSCGLTDLLGVKQKLFSWQTPPIWPESGMLCVATPVVEVWGGGQEVQTLFKIPNDVSVLTSLSAANSKYFTPSAASILWAQTGGDMAVSFGTPTSPVTAVNVSTPNGSKAIVTASITTNITNLKGAKTFTLARNQLPIAKGVLNVQGDTLTADANASIDTDADVPGSVVRYYWQFADGRFIDSPNPIQSLKLGSLSRPVSAALYVTDDTGDTSKVVQITETVSQSTNRSPVASITGSDTSSNLCITLDPSGSVDSDDNIARYFWYLGDGNSASTTIPTMQNYCYISAGTYTVTLTVTDNRGATGSATRRVTVANGAPPVSGVQITSQPRTISVTVGQPAIFLVSTTGSQPINYQWSKNGIPISGATLPSYMLPSSQLSDSGSTFSVVVSNVVGSVFSNSATLTVAAAPAAALSITTTAFNPSTATVGTGYAAQAAIAATGGQAPYSCSASGLPNGMAMSSSSCAIYGTPTVSGMFYVTVTVYDSSNPQKTASTVLSLTVGQIATTSAQITVSPTSLNFGSVPVGSCGSAIFTIQSVSGSASGTVNISTNPPFSIYLGSSFTVSNGSAANVSIQFCPTSVSSYSGTATITSNATFTGVSSVALSGTAIPTVIPLAISTSSSTLPGGNVGSGYSTSLGASGGTSPYTWSLVQGTQLPQGLSLSSAGVISGTPITAGTTSFQVQATDSAQPTQTVQKQLSISIVGIPPGQLTLSAANECSSTIPQVRLTWTQASSVDYYQVYKDGSLLTGVSTTLPSYLDTAVALGSTHSYFIRAVNTGGTTDSNTANLSVSCATPPGQFTLSAVTTCSGTSPVNVLHLTGSAGAVLPNSVYRDGALLTTLSVSDFSDTAVTPGTSYTYLATASNSVGSTNSNSVVISTAANCAVPVNPSITSFSPQTATVGGGAFTLTVSGSNFDSSSKIFWDPSGGTPITQLPTNFVNSTTLTASINQTTSGFSPFTWAGTYAVQVMNTATSTRSNTVNFMVYNPVPTISSVSGSCRANLNCTPANGYDVRINGNGFVNNSTTSYVYSTFLQVNGANANMSTIGQGPIYNQLQLMVNGSLIPTAGTYTLNVCNEGTIQGQACASGSLSVTP